jgi:hypothetical protein
MNGQPVPSRACWTCSGPAIRGRRAGKHLEYFCDRHGSGSPDLLSAPTPDLTSWAECLRCHRISSNGRDERTVIIRVGIPGSEQLCRCEEPSQKEWLLSLVP